MCPQSAGVLLVVLTAVVAYRIRVGGKPVSFLCQSKAAELNSKYCDALAAVVRSSDVGPSFVLSHIGVDHSGVMTKELQVCLQTGCTIV